MTKRRGRQARSIDPRVSRQISPKESVLIVCEGEITEPDYFKALGRELGLIGRRKHVEVEVIGKECGSAPISVINYALQLREQRAAKACPSQFICEFDQIYCVIDRDKHESLDDAYQKAKDNGIKVILSNPCFEYWFLLHFVKHARSFQHHREVTGVIRTKYSQYSKNRITGKFFESIYPNTVDAIRHAKEVIRENHSGNNDLRNCNPSTHVHLLVEYLRNMAQKPY